MSEQLNIDKPAYLTDLSLASACAEGNESAWEEFKNKYFSFIYDFARYSMRSETEGDDVATAVISDLWQRKKIGMYQGLSSLRTWLGAVISNAAINELKKTKRVVSTNDAEFRSWEKENVVLPDESTSGKIKASEIIKQCLIEQPAEDKLLLLLYYQQGLTLREITALFSLTEASLSRRLNKIRERLRKEIKRKLGKDYDTVSELFEDPSRFELDLQSTLGPQK
jgi:RNA polymerase sigma-70 factor (ECF subfamily)